MDADFWDQALVNLRLAIAPALVASLVVMLVLRLLMGEKFAPLAAALAVAAGFFAAEHFRQNMREIVHDSHPRLADLRYILGQALEPKPPSLSSDDSPSPPTIPQRHYWLPWLAGLAMLAELLVRLPRIPTGVGWAVRTFVVLIAARLLTPDSYRLKWSETPWLLGGAMLLEWAVLAALARQWKDSTTSIVVVACLGAASLVVALQGLGPSLLVMTAYCIAPFLGPALVAWKWPSDTGPAMAAAAVLLPAVLLMANETTESPERPLLNYLLVGLAPLALLPMLLPVLARQPGWKHWLLALLLPAIPLTLGIVWVLHETPLPPF